MKVLVVCGFLGAGKTTFIKELVKRTKKDFVVLENEYGAANIDSGELKENAEGEMNVWELTEGCACCTMKKDFTASVLTIANTLDPEYLIVEPTGAAMLSNMMANLKQIEYERIVLLKPLLILDGEFFFKNMAEYSELIKNQLKYAGSIVFSKTENASKEEYARLCEEAEKYTSAAVSREHYKKLPDEWYLSLLSDYLDENMRPEKIEEELSLETMTVKGAELKSPEELILFLQKLVLGGYGNIARAKGCLKTGDIWLRFDVVSERYAITGCEPKEEAETVFIGEKLRRDLIRQELLPVFSSSGFKTSKKRAADKKGGLRELFKTK